ncbi:RsmB/NOP family class I SAM-dependent RNA methyltransferase [archaeon]|jgi:tRNA (cytosine49-C5)-methyltransferase|nr:RsmB/NOP family class I SAM-dependent RNA methyltransferase [archaeon]MBT3451136.1 RsmB/NOP family class I SAM-dependent RNA methyltransferase [archaeon]MBT6869540.1 RsmB/NOP family class I SAM-dependent RNA methyltransferase [archaeon]MBT7193705.1 RsmB/NOP family class I SAM-dependent RNA methyltransferase [archaeon]MBT7380396.1 RsmB/NOP family class I SAM-dependent RNA methyltransferase [archaeon]
MVEHKLTAIPNTENVEIKQGFIDRYSKLTDWEEFKKYCLCFLRRSIRVNTLKADIEETRKSIESKGWKLEPIPWCKGGFFISHPDRKDVGNLWEHHIGKIYVQESVSMLPPLALDPKPGDIVLDMCAAPGSKTTQMAAMMKNQGLLIANDYKGMRIQSLGINLQRSAASNTIVTLMSGTRYKDFQFDKILVDAPCSGTGTIRKSLKTLRIWNPSMLRKISNEQFRLAENAFLNLKPGGVMVYSTCSLEPEENEAVVTRILNRFDNAKVEKVNFPGLKIGTSVMEFEGVKYHEEVKDSVRIWPQDNDTEGFFVCRIKKLLDE